MNADELKKADEIVKKLRTECSDCSERCCCNHGNNPVKYCPVVDAADLIDSLTAQLTASQRREKAAVEDLKGNSCCAACVNRYADAHHEPCRSCHGGSKFEWRGPQEAEKGKQSELYR